MIIRLDKDRELLFDIDAFEALEDILDAPVFSVFSDPKYTASVAGLCKILWAGLKRKEDLSLGEVKDIFPLKRFTEIQAACLKEAGIALGTVEESEEGETKKKGTKVSGNGSLTSKETVTQRE